MAEVSITVDALQLRNLIAHLEDGAVQIYKITTEVVSKAVQLGEVHAKANLSGRILGPRTGRLRASIKGRVLVEDGAVTAELGILQPKDAVVPLYGAAQEFGGEAKPVNAKVMTIPLKAALTAAGVPRFTALGAKKEFDRTFWWKNVLYGVKSQKGRGKRKVTRGTTKFGVTRAKGQQKDKIIPLFAAATHVRIGGGPNVGRRYLQDARDQLVQPLKDSLITRIAELLISRTPPPGSG